MSYKRRVLSLNCTVFVLSEGGEGSMIIGCSALDVPRTNCISFVSLCSRELRGRREQFVNVCNGDFCDSNNEKKKLANIQYIRSCCFFPPCLCYVYVLFTKKKKKSFQMLQRSANTIIVQTQRLIASSAWLFFFVFIEFN